jgi:hypothetical protein
LTLSVKPASRTICISAVFVQKCTNREAKKNCRCQKHPAAARSLYRRLHI